MILVVAAAVEREGRFLAALRGPGMKTPGVWEFPGGKVEPGETEAEALVREIAEELGARIEVRERVGETDDGRIRLILHRCVLAPGSPEPQAREHADLRWVSPAEFPELAWAPLDVPLVGQLGIAHETR